MSSPNKADSVLHHSNLSRRRFLHMAAMSISSFASGWGGLRLAISQNQIGTLTPPKLPVSPNWSLVGHYGGYYRARDRHGHPAMRVAAGSHGPAGADNRFHDHHAHPAILSENGPWNLDCPCYLG